MLTINSAVQWWAKMRPDTRALVYGGDSVSYAEWAGWIDRVAACLEGLGVKPGDRVNMCGPNGLAYSTLIFAAMRCGAIAAPLNYRFTRPELAEIVEDHGSVLIFADSSVHEKLEGNNVPIHSFDEVTRLRIGAPARVAHDPRPDDCVLIISTSGSTAKPKGVMYSHRSMLGYVYGCAIEDPELVKGGGVIVVAPLSTSAGTVQLVHYITFGCTLFGEPVFSPERFLEILVTENIVNFAGAPAFFEKIAALPAFKDAAFPALQIVCAGGARVTRELYDAWAAKGLSIRQTYGQTEVGGNSTVMPTHLAGEFPEKCGWGGMFTEHRVVDEQGNDLPPNTEGQILMRGPGMMLGYWNNPQATAEAIRDGWLWSGDIGTMDERGLITFIDRIKDIIVSGGLNISAAEIERAVLEFPGIEEAAAIAAFDPKFQETPLVVVYAGGEEIDVAALIQHCNARLADFKVPRFVAVRSEPLPRLATNKISKPELRAEYKDAHLTLPKVR